MTQQDGLYHDTEAALVTWATARDDIAAAGNATNDTLDANLPFVRFMRTAGQDDGVTDRAVVDVDVFAATRSQALAVAEAIRRDLRPRTRAGAAIIDSVRTSVSPRQLPWGNNSIARQSATYGITLRR